MKLQLLTRWFFFFTVFPSFHLPAVSFLLSVSTSFSSSYSCLLSPPISFSFLSTFPCYYFLSYRPIPTYFHRPSYLPFPLFLLSSWPSFFLYLCSILSAPFLLFLLVFILFLFPLSLTLPLSFIPYLPFLNISLSTHFFHLRHSLPFPLLCLLYFSRVYLILFTSFTIPSYFAQRTRHSPLHARNITLPILPTHLLLGRASHSSHGPGKGRGGPRSRGSAHQPHLLPLPRRAGVHHHHAGWQHCDEKMPCVSVVRSR